MRILLIAICTITTFNIKSQLEFEKELDIKFVNNQWSCAAITLSHKYNLSNPLDTAYQSWYGKTYSKMS